MSTNGMISNSGGSLWRQRATALYSQKLPASIWAFVITILMLGLVYAPNFRDLYSIWNNDPNYSHGKLVIPIALFILWRRLSEPHVEQRSSDIRAPWWGWLLLAGTLAVRAIAYELNSQWVETATLVPAIACITWTFGGWPLLRRVWPAIVFLLFLLPLPGAVNELMAHSVAVDRRLGKLLLASVVWILGDSRGKRYQPWNTAWSCPAGHSPCLQRLEDADDHGRHDYGDDHSHPYADMEADYPARQYDTNRACLAICFG